MIPKHHPTTIPLLLFLFLILLFGPGKASAGEYTWLEKTNPQRETVSERFPPPAGYTRVPVGNGSLAEWLRGLPLFPEGRKVHLVDGSLKSNQTAHLAVVDMDVIRFQQCADAIIRLLAEYLWSIHQPDRICFRFTSGDLCCWKKWSAGWRPVVSGSKVRWVQKGTRDSSRGNFREYLQKVFEYAGTISLKSELRPVTVSDLRIGDVILQPGSPGHAVFILDQVRNTDGTESFSPGPELHAVPGISYSKESGFRFLALVPTSAGFGRHARMAVRKSYPGQDETLGLRPAGFVPQIRNRSRNRSRNLSTIGPILHRAGRARWDSLPAMVSIIYPRGSNPIRIISALAGTLVPSGDASKALFYPRRGIHKMRKPRPATPIATRWRS